MTPYTNLGLVDEPSTYADLFTKPLTTHWDINWSDLKLTETVLGRGHFGEVREGMYKKDGEELKVAVKTLNGN